MVAGFAGIECRRGSVLEVEKEIAHNPQVRGPIV
jgi:hypothetical protein